MIKVNLIGTSRKKIAKGGAAKAAVPTNAMPLVLALIVIGTIAGGYLWYSSLTAQSADLDQKIASAQAQKAALDAVIKTNAVYESRKKALENRIRVIEGLKKNQVNPIVALDVLSEAIQRTQYVWLSQLDQSNSILSMSGIGTSVNAIADFVTNLENSRQFRNIDLNHATDSAGNFTFSLKCEFAPPANAPAPAAATSGGN
jgi:Tfp pilus assembly protein PilN